MAWSPYKACCLESARDPDYALCGECGHVLLRCMAFEDCQTLVDPKGHCPACVMPELTLDRGALPSARAGDRLALTFLFANRSRAQRALRCEAVEAFVDEAQVPVTLAWAEVEAGTERRFTVGAPALEQGGRHALRLLLVLSSRFKGREESYMFESLGQIAVARDSDTAAPQITISGNVSGGGLINIAGLAGPAGAAGAEPPVALPSLLQRADAAEAARGLRGYGPRGGRIPRDAGFVFAGFRALDRPPDQAVIGPRGLLSCGRAARKFDAVENPQPSDLALRLYKGDGATLDEEATRALSRHHFDLFIANGRLHLQVRSGNGLDINGARLATGAIRSLADGDIVAPLPGQPARMALHVSFSGHHDEIDTVQVARRDGPPGPARGTP